MTAFDRTAAEFERLRALPDSAAEAVARAVRSMLGPGRQTLLDLGAGTGRFGKALIGEVDRYVGLDRSTAMLRQFRAALGKPQASGARLVLGEGTFLPFRQESFDAVLLAHVVSGTSHGPEFLAEARRVLGANGVLLLAQRKGPASGLDARLREQLRVILARLGVLMPEAGSVRRDAQDGLAKIATSRHSRVAARWNVERSPRDFLERHPTGVRFAALPPAVQRESMRQLSEWATKTFGTLDAAFVEEDACDLDAFRF